MGQSLNRAFITDFTRNMGSARDLLGLLLIIIITYLFSLPQVFFFVLLIFIYI